MSDPAGSQALLDGVRVVDLTGDYGAFAARLLADLGAEVVRIETPGGQGRGRPPLAPDGSSLHHLHRNVGKVIVELPTGDPRRDGLLAGADVAFISRASLGVPGSAEAPDLAAAQAVLDRHPHLVVVALTPFGLAGDASTWASTELVAQSLAGVVYRSGVPELPPCSAPGSYCEDVGATLGAFAALLGLWRRRDDGMGEVIDVSSVLALAQCTEMGLPLWSLLDLPPTRAGAGAYPLFACRDGLARLVLPMTPGDWRSLIRWLGSPPEWTGPEWEAAILGPAQRAEIVARLPARFAASSREQIAAEGDAAGVRITPVLTPGEVLANEHTAARATFQRMPYGGGQAAVASALISDGGTRPAVVAPRSAGVPEWTARPAPSGGGAGGGLPLRGIRVLEVGSGVAAPEATRLLAEWGAEVLKIETVRHADFQRRVLGGEMNPAFSTPNRNKLGVAIELAEPAGLELVHRLLPHIDVLVENNATGVIERLGLGWETASAINPRLVAVGTQLYGTRGPWASKKGYGPSARAIGGLAWLWAHGPDAPRGVSTIHPDHVAGRLGALAALAGLFRRERTGVGSRLDIAQFEAVSGLIGDLLAAESLTPGSVQPVGNASANHAPWGVYRCRDDEQGAESWLAVTVTDDEMWRALLGVAPAGLAKPQWSSQSGRLAEAAALDASLSAWLADEDVTAVEGALQRAGVAAGRLIHPRLMAEHPLYTSRGFPQPLDQPYSGRLILEGPAFSASRSGTPRLAPAPMIGEHTPEVLSRLLGIDADGFAALVASGAVEPPLVPG